MQNLAISSGLFAIVATGLVMGFSSHNANVSGPGGQSAADASWMDRVAIDAMHTGDEPSLQMRVADSESLERVNSIPSDRIPTVDGRRVSDRLSNVELLDQHGRTLRFYDDILADRSVCIVFFYTRCVGSCPGTTVRLKKIRRLIADEFPGDDFKFVSLTLEPEIDTSAELKEYMDRYRISEDPNLPEWIFATGVYEEVDGLRRELGVYDLDPIIDADKTEHAAIVTFGNDRTDRWAALPVGMGTQKVADTIVRITGNTLRQRYRSVVSSSQTLVDPSAKTPACCQDKPQATKPCCQGKETIKKPCCQAEKQLPLSNP